MRARTGMIAMFLLMNCCEFLNRLAMLLSLPDGGGEPGKAYKECIDAVAKPDKAATVSLCFVKDDPWIKKTNLDYFTNETFQVEVRGFVARSTFDRFKDHRRSDERR